MSRDQVLAAVRGVRSELLGCLLGGWADYRAYDGRTRLVHTRRTRANVVRDHVLERLRRLCDRAPNLRLLKIGGLDLVAIYDGGALVALARVKRLARGLLARNIATQQAIAFDEQRPLQLRLDGFAEPAHLNLGYVLDIATESQIVAAYLTCPSGARFNAWVIDLAEEPRTVVAPLVRVEEPRQVPALPIRTRRRPEERSTSHAD